MKSPLPNLTKEQILQAIVDFDEGVSHVFGKSVSYDLIWNDRRYPPKAIVGLAAEQVLGKKLRPEDFRGGLGTPCFRILERHGFKIVPKKKS